MDDEEEISEVYIHFKAKFKASRIIEQYLFSNEYEIRTDILLETENLTDENIEYQTNLSIAKFNFFIDEVITDSIFMSMYDEWAVNNFIKENGLVFNNNLVACPFTPIDDRIAVLLQAKFSALGKGFVTINNLTIESDNPTRLYFTHIGKTSNTLPTMEEWIGKHSYFDKPWWDRDDASTYDLTPHPDSDLTQTPPYAYSLDFLSKTFIIDDNEIPNKIIKPNFRPVIIKND